MTPEAPAICWDCVKHRHSLCTGQDDPPPVGTGGRCECDHAFCEECETDDDA